MPDKAELNRWRCSDAGLMDVISMVFPDFLGRKTMQAYSPAVTDLKFCHRSAAVADSACQDLIIFLHALDTF